MLTLNNEFKSDCRPHLVLYTYMSLTEVKDNRNRLKTKTIFTCIKNLIWLITDFKF